METANEKLLDQSINHAVEMQGYSNSVVKKMLSILNRADADLFQKITLAIENLPRSQVNIDRLNSLLKSVRELNNQTYVEIKTELNAELKEMVAYEVQYQQASIKLLIPEQAAFTTVSPVQVYAAAIARPFQISKGGAVPLNEYLSGLSEVRAAAIRDAVRLGFIEGETIQQTVKRIKGTKALSYTDGLMEASRRHIEGMVRTAINHTSTFARNSIFEANEDIVKGWKFLSVLDNRTSITCASLSGRIYPVGNGPMPPRHINCRSTMVPVLKSWRELGIDIDEISPSTRSSLDGQIPEDITFSDWLKKKNSKFQDEILGATRGKLFRENKADVTVFTNNKGVVYSIEELKKRNSELFVKAGL